MSIKDSVPSWFKTLPIYADQVKRERTDAEATRARLAAERASLQAAELKAGAKREKANAAAAAALIAAEAAVIEARLEYAKAIAQINAESYGAAHRLGTIDTELRRLAAPEISAAVVELATRFDMARRTDGNISADRVAAIRIAQQQVEALYQQAGIDAAAEVRRILTALDAPAPAAELVH